MPDGNQRPGAYNDTTKAALGKSNLGRRLGLDLAFRELNNGITPLEIMLGVMRMEYKAGNLTNAMAAAIMAAPYVHPKLTRSQVVTTVKQDVGDFTDEDLEVIASSATETLSLHRKNGYGEDVVDRSVTIDEPEPFDC